MSEKFINTAEWLERIRNASDQIQAIQAIVKANPRVGNEDVFQGAIKTIEDWPPAEHAAGMFIFSMMSVERSFHIFKNRKGLQAQSALASLLTDVRLMVFWYESWERHTSHANKGGVQ